MEKRGTEWPQTVSMPWIHLYFTLGELNLTVPWKKVYVYSCAITHHTPGCFGNHTLNLATCVAWHCGTNVYPWCQAHAISKVDRVSTVQQWRLLRGGWLIIMAGMEWMEWYVNTWFSSVWYHSITLNCRHYYEPSSLHQPPLLYDIVHSPSLQRCISIECWAELCCM